MFIKKTKQQKNKNKSTTRTTRGILYKAYLIKLLLLLLYNIVPKKECTSVMYNIVFTK